MRIYYYDHHEFTLPPHHRFPLEKYRMLRERILEEELIFPEELIPAKPASIDDLLLAHTPEYIQQILQGTLPRQLEREMGLPWSKELALRVRHTVGASISAARTSLREGIAATTGGGTHHAQVDRPQGYCLFNDAIIAARALQREGLIQRALVVDCDVHQGNGTALIAADDPSIFTFSIHCQDNFPVRKAKSDLDIGLPAGTGDEAYLNALSSGLDEAVERAKPDWVIYLAGADPYQGDRLGRLDLTIDGLARRDQMVLNRINGENRPVTLTLAGGYGNNISETVEIYLQTLKIGVQFYNQLIINNA